MTVALTLTRSYTNPSCSKPGLTRDYVWTCPTCGRAQGAKDVESTPLELVVCTGCLSAFEPEGMKPWVRKKRARRADGRFNYERAK